MNGRYTAVQNDSTPLTIWLKQSSASASTGMAASARAIMTTEPAPVALLLPQAGAGGRSGAQPVPFIPEPGAAPPGTRPTPPVDSTKRACPAAGDIEQSLTVGAGIGLGHGRAVD